MTSFRMIFSRTDKEKSILVKQLANTHTLYVYSDLKDTANILNEIPGIRIILLPKKKDTLYICTIDPRYNAEQVAKNAEKLLAIYDNLQ